MFWGIIPDLVLGAPKSSPMPDIGDDMTADLRGRVCAFRHGAGLMRSLDNVGFLGRLDWWRLNRAVQRVRSRFELVHDPLDDVGPITAERSGDCKQFAASVAAALKGWPVHFAYCLRNDGGHVVAALITDRGVYVADYFGGFMPWEKTGYALWRIERDDPAEPWQVATN